MDADLVLLIGRIVFSIMFIASGVGHLMDTEGSTAYAQGKGLGDNSKLLVQISGVCLALGGVATLLGIWVDLALLLIAVLVLVIGFMMHAFWKETDQMAQQMEMSMFMKNLTIAGGALMGSAIYGVDGADPSYTLVDTIGLWSVG